MSALRMVYCGLLALLALNVHASAKVTDQEKVAIGSLPKPARFREFGWID